MFKVLIKKENLFIITFLLTLNSFSQPSDATILSKIKSFSKNKNIISVKLNGTRGGARKEIEKGVRVTNFYRSYNTRFKTQYDGIISTYHGMVKYGYRGGVGYF